MLIDRGQVGLHRVGWRTQIVRFGGVRGEGQVLDRSGVDHGAIRCTAKRRGEKVPAVGGQK